MESSAPTANELLLENEELRTVNSSLAAKNEVLKRCLKKTLCKLGDIIAHVSGILNSDLDRQPIQRREDASNRTPAAGGNDATPVSASGIAVTTSTATPVVSAAASVSSDASPTALATPSPARTSDATQRPPDVRDHAKTVSEPSPALEQISNTEQLASIPSAAMIDKTMPDPVRTSDAMQPPADVRDHTQTAPEPSPALAQISDTLQLASTPSVAMIGGAMRTSDAVLLPPDSPDHPEEVAEPAAEQVADATQQAPDDGKKLDTGGRLGPRNASATGYRKRTLRPRNNGHAATTNDNTGDTKRGQHEHGGHRLRPRINANGAAGGRPARKSDADESLAKSPGRQQAKEVDRPAGKVNRRRRTMY